MQRVSSLLPAWNSNRSTNPKVTSLDKVRGWTDRIPSGNHRRSVARLSTNALLPEHMDKECEKAARIIRSFCSDGFATPEDRPGTPSTYSSGHSNQLLKKIPPMIIQNAVGLAVFTSMRSGIWGSSSGGSGILIARKTDGSWSPPSGLLVHTGGLGLALGVDVYDCILVINNFTVLESFARPSLILGTTVALTPGPLVSLGLLENDISWTDLSDSAITYVKSNGQASDFKLDGTVLNERTDENDRFYGMRIGVAKILSGDINQSMPQTRLLTEILKVAEGRTDFDTSLIEQYAGLPSPGDATIESPQSVGSPTVFGMPTRDDPDPFGVLALEMAGLEIREAGTRLRPESHQFEYAPSPTSPVFSKTGRRSIDTYLSRSNRGSCMSSKTVATERSHQSQTTDMGTQTCNTAVTTPSPSQSQSEDGHPQVTSETIPEVREPQEVDYTKIDISALRKLSNFPDLEDAPAEATAIIPHQSDLEVADNTNSEKETETPSSAYPDVTSGDLKGAVESDSDEFDEADDEDDEDDEFEDAEEAVVYEVATAQAPQRVAITASHGVHAKGAVVTIPRRIPPPLPSRSPARMSRRKSQMAGSSMIKSPLRQEFDTGILSEGTSTPKADDTTATSTGSISSVAASHKDEWIPDSSDTGDSERAATPTKDAKSQVSSLPETPEIPDNKEAQVQEHQEDARHASTETRKSSEIEPETIETPEASRGVPILA